MTDPVLSLRARMAHLERRYPDKKQWAYVLRREKLRKQLKRLLRKRSPKERV